MVKRTKTWQEGVKDAIWYLTCAEGDLRGISGYEGIGEDILILRDKLKKIFENGGD